MKNLMKVLDKMKGGCIQISQYGAVEDELEIKEFNYCERKDNEDNMFLILQDDNNGYERKINEFFISNIEATDEPIIHTENGAIQLCLIN